MANNNNKEVIFYGRGPQEIAEDSLLKVLEMPSINVSREEAVRFNIQLRSILVDEKAAVEQHILNQEDTPKWREKAHKLHLKAEHALRDALRFSPTIHHSFK